LPLSSGRFTSSWNSGYPPRLTFRLATERFLSDRYLGLRIFFELSPEFERRAIWALRREEDRRYPMPNPAHADEGAFRAPSSTPWQGWLISPGQVSGAYAMGAKTAIPALSLKYVAAIAGELWAEVSAYAALSERMTFSGSTLTILTCPQRLTRRRNRCLQTRTITPGTSCTLHPVRNERPGERSQITRGRRA
jgi:hypothetical protein